ncbi:hypothetical protein TK06_19860 [Pseudomonas fluorescens]|uniref:Uncharacterized protein n=1 Tax=Pseudomonas fluorescens TaxID=294 RepID=A0A165ZIK3_PSEFL|nr:hypothetical protein TK06_19860 [Pseudomonas fluorescens]
MMLQLCLLGSGSVHADCYVDICFFFLQLPDINFVLAGGFRLSINEARRFGRFKLMMPVMDTDAGGLQGPDISVLRFF